MDKRFFNINFLLQNRKIRYLLLKHTKHIKMISILTKKNISSEYSQQNQVE